MVNHIGKVMAHRPPRHHETKCLYVWGPPGTGKSTTIHRVLKTFQKLDPRAGYYPKMGALKKFWDGYDNQPFVLIDDPGQFNAHFAAFKNVISTGALIVEVKGSAMQFDSRLVIVVSNTDPESLANTAGLWGRDAIFDRLVGLRSVIKGGIYSNTTTWVPLGRRVSVTKCRWGSRHWHTTFGLLLASPTKSD